MTEAPVWRRREPFAGQTVAFSARYHADRREGRLGNTWTPKGTDEAALRGTVVRVVNGWMCIVRWHGLDHENGWSREHIVATIDITHDAAEWSRRVGGKL